MKVVARRVPTPRPTPRQAKSPVEDATAGFKEATVLRYELDCR